MSGADHFPDKTQCKGIVRSILRSKVPTLGPTRSCFRAKHNALESCVLFETVKFPLLVWDGAFSVSNTTHLNRVLRFTK